MAACTLSTTAPTTNAMDAATIPNNVPRRTRERKLPPNPIVQYVQRNTKVVWSKETGISTNVFDRKYGAAPYVPVANSRRNIGRSNGNPNIVACISPIIEAIRIWKMLAK